MYIVGIDFGTTNSTMAFTAVDDPEGVIHQFQIPQQVAHDRHESHDMLPSFLHFPLKQETKDEKPLIGLFARDRGAELPGRTISSPKSWLCHLGIDRRALILPHNIDFEDKDCPKMSPLDACAAILKHLKESWEQQMPPLKDQQVLITVPASFDPGARQLVQEAAEKAGFPEIILLEEPQAAFYAWLKQHEAEWRDHLKVGDTILVVDVGGGTTDFSLISVEEEAGNLTLQRQAVGAHLLLGGDNIDLALAHLARNKLEEQGHSIDDWQMQALIHTCRQAKENLLSDRLESVNITIMGRGSRLIGGTLTTQITSQEAEAVILDGFMPLSAPEERSLPEKRSGIQQIGLPYAQDPRISCQLAKFLSMSAESESVNSDKFVMPSALLVNGGTFKSAILQKRLIELLNSWAKKLNKPAVKVLQDPELDLAVSRGAVSYGLARQGKQIRIKSGTSRSYYIGVEDASLAVPGVPVSLKAICIVPFGLEEGSELHLSNQEFALVLGEQATFRFFSHGTRLLSNGVEPTMGTVVRNWKQELTELHPIETRLDKSDQDGKSVPVTLKSKVTELGVLELWCVAHDGRNWKLEFALR